MDLKTGKCWPSDSHEYVTADTFRHHMILHPHVAVPKDYINFWKSGHKCEREGCFEDGVVVCHVPDYPPLLSKEPYDYTGIKIIEHLCQDHAYEAGYCTICGDFWGGIESFDFNNPSKLCENCQEQIIDENCEEDEEDSLWYEDFE